MATTSLLVVAFLVTSILILGVHCAYADPNCPCTPGQECYDSTADICFPKGQSSCPKPRIDCGNSTTDDFDDLTTTPADFSGTTEKLSRLQSTSPTPPPLFSLSILFNGSYDQFISNETTALEFLDDLNAVLGMPPFNVLLSDMYSETVEPGWRGNILVKLKFTNESAKERVRLLVLDNFLKVTYDGVSLAARIAARPNSASKSSQKALYVGLGVGAAVLAVVVVILGMMIKRRRTSASPPVNAVPLNDFVVPEEESVHIRRHEAPILEDGRSLHNIVIEKDLEALKRMISRQSDVNQSNARKQTALHVACLQPSMDPVVVKELLRAKASVLLKGVVALLVAAGADVNARDNQGMTPLMHATSKGHDEAVQCLVNEKALHSYLTDSRGWTAMHWAASCGEVKCAEIIQLERRFNLKVVSLRGETVLHIAAKEDNSQIILRLLKYHTPKTRSTLLEMRTHENLTVLEVAQRCGAVDCVAAIHSILGLPPVSCAVLTPESGSQSPPMDRIASSSSATSAQLTSSPLTDPTSLSSCAPSSEELPADLDEFLGFPTYSDLVSEAELLTSLGYLETGPDPCLEVARENLSGKKAMAGFGSRSSSSFAAHEDPDHDVLPLKRRHHFDSF